MAIRQKSSHRWLTRLGALLVATVTVLAATVDCGEPPRRSPPRCEEGWPCPAASIHCLHPCMRGLRAPPDGELADETLRLCTVEQTFERSRRVGESFLASYGWYSCADAAWVAWLTDELGGLGHRDLALSIEALHQVRSDDPDGALVTLEAARAAGGARCPLSRIANEVSRAYYMRGQLGKAGAANRLALDLSEPGSTQRGYLLTASLRILAATRSVDEAIARSTELLQGLDDMLLRAWIHLQRVDLLYLDGAPRTAENEAVVAIASALVDRALVARGLRARHQVLSAAFYNLASLLRERQRLDAAERLLEVTRELTPDDSLAEQYFARALIERERGRLDLAEAGLAAALKGGSGGGPPTGDLAWAVPFELGQVRLGLGDRAGAEEALRRALDEVEVLREGAPDSEAQMIAQYRQPYEVLLGLLAEAERWHDALEVLARLDAGRFNSEAATPSAFLMGRLLQLGGGGFASWDVGASAAPTAEVLLDAWRGRHLVAVFHAGRRLCRIEVHDGGLVGTCPGDAAALEAAAGALHSNPAEAEAARLLGAALVPPGDDQLDLLLVGPIARTPLAALRDEHGLIVARRPLRRVLGLLDAGRGRAVDGPPRVVGYAGATGNATSAVDEARTLAAMLGVEPQVDGAATAPAVLGGGAGLLHVAGHARSDGDGVPHLELADGGLTAPQIASLTAAPRLVVLANCDSASARDDGSWGSLGAAFLHAGSDEVIASDRPVDDDESRALMVQFYERGGVRAPARVLGEVAAGLGRAAPSSPTWAAFTVIAAPPRPPR